jgi:hypothetical protein
MKAENSLYSNGLGWNTETSNVAGGILQVSNYVVSKFQIQKDVGIKIRDYEIVLAWKYETEISLEVY